MPSKDLVLRTMHDVGLAAWFGGSLAGAVGINGAANDVSDPTERLKVSSAGWARWAPVNAAAIGTHLIGAVGLLTTNRDRVKHQDGVAAASVGKTLVTVLALAATGVSGWLGQQKSNYDPVPTEGGVKPAETTPPDIAARQQQLRALQWTIPSLTGVLVALTAQQGELQKPGNILLGVARDRFAAGSKAVRNQLG